MVSCWVTAKILYPWHSSLVLGAQLKFFIFSGLNCQLAHSSVGQEEWAGRFGYHPGPWEATVTSSGKAVLCWVGTGTLLVPDLCQVDMLDLTLKGFAIMLKKAR